MKISKLFHWLYAALMFLPLVFFLPSLFYYGFNEHATNTETTTINYKYESNEVNTLDDIVAYNIYELDAIYLSYNNDDFILDINIYSYTCSTEVMYYLTQNNNFIDAQFNRSYNNKESFIHLSIDSGEMVLSFPNSQDLVSNLVYSDYDIELDNVIFFIEENNLNNFNDWFELYGNDLPHYTDYNVIESVSVNTDDTITDKLNRSFNAIFDLPLFAWSKTTFVSSAFVYIGSVFGWSANNPLNYLFGYFATISICWLVFDVILYVPNLAHRWLDRSAIE